METPSRSPTAARVRNTASLYDYVKVRVWLADGDGGEGSSHVLSRFLLARTLTAALVPYELAVKVSLEVKKHLVDDDTLDVSRDALEALTFRLLRQRQVGEDVLSRCRLLSAFHARRQPLVLLLGGGMRSCKSTVGAKGARAACAVQLPF
jgi:2-phosphoglycerate kinase